MTVDDQITFIYVADLDRSAEFYGGALGFELVQDQGSCLIYRVTPTSFLGVCVTRPERVGLAGALVTFVTEDVDAWHARVVQAGGTIVRDLLHSEEYQIYNFFAADLDGNQFEVQRFDDPGWKVADA
ncbi:MAG: VOC family protein [Acidimicrobiia bacterium]|nr:VOC family protein [Acidimicrobiia bacterium]